MSSRPSFASPACPATSRSGAASKSSRVPARTTGWSSTITTVMARAAPSGCSWRAASSGSVAFPTWAREAGEHSRTVHFRLVGPSAVAAPVISRGRERRSSTYGIRGPARVGSGFPSSRRRAENGCTAELLRIALEMLVVAALATIAAYAAFFVGVVAWTLLRRSRRDPLQDELDRLLAGILGPRPTASPVGQRGGEGPGDGEHGREAPFAGRRSS